MGFDIEMVDPPTKAEIQKAHLDKDSPGYYRFNWSAMPVMVLTMTWAGAVVDERAPEWPPWPPAGTADDRKQLISDALFDRTLEPQLTVEERKATIAMRSTYKKLQATPGKQKGKVPSFKFQWNDGYVVTKAECAVIATKLRAFARTVTADKLGELDAAYRKSQQPLLDAAKERGETVLAGDGGLGLTLDDYKAWIAEWAAFNEVASHHHGYAVK